MEPIFVQADFSGGLNRQLDATKLTRNAYPLATNIRVRTNNVTPVKTHLQLNAPQGKVQGLKVAGSNLYTVVSGQAYYCDLTQSTLQFNAIGGWQPMSANAPKVYIEPVPTTFSFFARNGAPESTVKVFSGSIAAYPACLIVQDGTNQPQAIFPNNTSLRLGAYASWTQDIPNYVPIGTVMCFSGAKLYIANGADIYQSVSGRPTDFVVNLKSDGTKGGDATTTKTAVSFNPVTAMDPLPGGNLLVRTQYATHVLTLDQNNTTFGEPNIIPDVAFPIGAPNDRSTVVVTGDETFIASNGIQSFNFAQYIHRNTNNGPFGAPIRSLLVTPQVSTAATMFDDYGLYSMQTIFGNGVVVYDSASFSQQFVSLDLGFGPVQQFATAFVDGKERLFFYTSDNLIFEAYAGSGTQTSSIYLGDFAQGVKTYAHGFIAGFTNIKTPGTVKVSIFADKELIYSGTSLVTSDYVANNGTVPLPYAINQSAQNFAFNFGKLTNASQVGAYVEWNFDGALEFVHFYGEAVNSWNPDLTAGAPSPEAQLLVLGNATFGANVIVADTSVAVTKGAWYYFAPFDSNSFLLDGNLRITSAGFYRAQGEYVYCNNASSLKECSTVYNILRSTRATNPETFSGIVLLGDTDPNLITYLRTLYGASNIIVTMGDRDYQSGLSWSAPAGIARYHFESAAGVNFACLNGGYYLSGTVVDPASGTPAGPVIEPDGNTILGEQYRWYKQLAAGAVVCVHEPPFSGCTGSIPGFVPLRWDFGNSGAQLVLSGHAGVYERYNSGSLVYVNIGTSGADPLGVPSPNSTMDICAAVPAYGILTVDNLDQTLKVYNLSGDLLDIV